MPGTGFLGCLIGTADATCTPSGSLPPA
jgi:hypothetical protein